MTEWIAMDWILTYLHLDIISLISPGWETTPSPSIIFVADWTVTLTSSVSNFSSFGCERNSNRRFFRGWTDGQTDRLVSWLHGRAEGTRVSSCYTTNIRPIQDFKCVKDACLLQCKSKEEPVVTLAAVMCRQEVCFVCYSSLLSLVVSCSDLSKHCLSSEKWSSDCDGWNLTLLTKEQKWRCSDPLIFAVRVLIPQVQTAATHAHASFTLQLHLSVLPAPVSTPVLSNSLVAFIFTHSQCLCWKFVLLWKYISHFHFHD